MNELSEKKRIVCGVFLLTVLGAFIGWVYEMIFYRIDLGYFIKRGHGFGPWLPIYAFGALGLILVVIHKKIHPAVLFIISVIGSGIIEFVTGWALYNFMGVRLWDYNVEIWNWGNIGGYVCFRSVAVFGVLGILFVRWGIPGLTKFTHNTPRKKLLAIFIPLAVIFFGDILFSYILKPLLFK